MRFHPELEAAFLASRSAALGASDIGVAALSCCLWLVQLLSFALARQQRMAGKVSGAYCSWLPLLLPSSRIPDALLAALPTVYSPFRRCCCWRSTSSP
jgi:hypothetical protein